MERRKKAIIDYTENNFLRRGEECAEYAEMFGRFSAALEAFYAARDREMRKWNYAFGDFPHERWFPPPRHDPKRKMVKQYAPVYQIGMDDYGCEWKWMHGFGESLDEPSPEAVVSEFYRRKTEDETTNA